MSEYIVRGEDVICGERVVWNIEMDNPNHGWKQTFAATLNSETAALREENNKQALAILHHEAQEEHLTAAIAELEAILRNIHLNTSPEKKAALYPGHILSYNIGMIHELTKATTADDPDDEYSDIVFTPYVSAGEEDEEK